MDADRHRTRTLQLDYVTVALGRMGFREAKFRELDRVLLEVVKDYAQLAQDDIKNKDKDFWYTWAALDRELARYTGKFFVPHEERY